MAGPLVADRVKETSTTTGTGTLDLAGAATGFRTFVAGIGTGNSCFYSIQLQGGSEWEVGIGTVTDAATDTLSRTSVIASSNSNALVSFSAGTKDVFVTYPASHWGPLFPLTPPVDADFAWINQGSATIAATNGGLLASNALYLSGPSNAGSYNWRIRKKAAPSAPYTITACFLLNTEIFTSVAQGLGAILWRQSSDSKLITMSLSTAPTTGAATSPLIEFAKWNNENSFSAYYDSCAVGFNPCPLLFVRLEDDNTNRKVHISVDGQNFIQLHSVGRTDFLTADEVGFAVSPFSQATGMTLLHWKEG